MKRTAAILLALLTIGGPAQALVVSEKVGPLLQQAQVLIQAKNYNAATAKLNEAEAVKATADDENVIEQMRQFIASTSLDPTKPHCDSRMGMTTCDGRGAKGAQP
jgi:hypothetical protein